MSVSEDLSPKYSKKTSNAMKAIRAVKRITFNPSEANPGEILNIFVPKLNENEVLVPNTLALVFDIDLTGGHANNFLVQNVSRALVNKLVVKFGGTELEQTVGYDIYKTFQDLFLPVERRDNMVPEGIQSEDLCKIRSGSGDKKTSGVDAENKLTQVYGKKYRINLEHQILTDHGIFYPQALYNDLVFEVTLAPANQVVKGGDPTKLKYKLTNIKLEYEMLLDNPQKDRYTLGAQATDFYTNGKEFFYDHVTRDKVIPFKKGSDPLINVKVNAQRRSMKGLLLLFVEPYTAGTRDSEKYIFPDIKKISVTINGSPNMLYNNGLESRDIWREVSRFFMKEKHKPQYMNIQKFYTDNKFGLLIDLRSMASQEMHGSGTRLVNSTDGIQLEIERTASGSGDVNCHVFIISDAKFDIIDKQLDSVQY